MKEVLIEIFCLNVLILIINNEQVNKETVTEKHCLLRIFELLYLWNALPSVSQINRVQIINGKILFLNFNFCCSCV